MNKLPKKANVLREEKQSPKKEAEKHLGEEKQNGERPDANPGSTEQSTGAKNQTVSKEMLFKQLSSSEDGLSSEEAQKRLEQYGPNAIEEEKENPILKFLGYFWGPIPWMIEVAAVLSLAVQHWTDFIIIVILLVFNAVVGFWQEFQASNALDALKSELALRARVLRDSKWQATSYAYVWATLFQQMSSSLVVITSWSISRHSPVNRCRWRKRSTT